jgi:aspartate/methionine/tyrosine aminotransferase
MKFSPLVQRISGEGADAWLTHYDACAARDRGEDVIVLSVGDPDLDTPAAVVDKAIERLRAGDTHYSPASGRLAVREVVCCVPVRCRSG